MLGFQSKIANVLTMDGRNFKAVKPITYISSSGRIFIIPEGASTDGASTPKTIWPLIPPFGDYWLAAYLHDCAYQNSLKENVSGLEVLASLKKEECDNLFLEAMISLGVDKTTAETMYLGVKEAGWKAFKEDRS